MSLDKTELKSRLAFRQTALERLRVAYLELVSGNVKSYALPDRQLTRLDLPDLANEIDKLEKQVDELKAQLAGRSARRAFGVLPRDW